MNGLKVETEKTVETEIDMFTIYKLYTELYVRTVGFKSRFA